MQNINSADSVYHNVPSTGRLLIPALLELSNRTRALDDFSSDLSGNEELVKPFTAIIRAYNLQSYKLGYYASNPILDEQQSEALIYLYHTLATPALDQDMLMLLNHYTFFVHSEMASKLIERSIRRRINPQVVPHENAQQLFVNANDQGGAPVMPMFGPGIFPEINQNQAADASSAYKTPPSSPSR